MPERAPQCSFDLHAGRQRQDGQAMKRFAADAAGAPAAFLPCQASLALGFASDGGKTRMIERTHFGPLRVQKPLYPEGDSLCHAVVVHPPGGVVGGDELSIAVSVKDGASALLATPGAAKWYKGNGRVSFQDVRFEVGAGASLEWLPQETILFNAAHVRLNQTVTLAKDAAYLACDILCFGRGASGESFDSGRIEQCSSIRCDGRLVWFEQGALSGGCASMHSPLALAGRSVFATLIAVGKPVPAAAVATLREEAAPMLQASDLFGVTQMKSVLVVRYLGDSSQSARHLMMNAWRRLRPELTSRQAVVPRIWNT